MIAELIEDWSNDDRHWLYALGALFHHDRVHARACICMIKYLHLFGGGVIAQINLEGLESIKKIWKSLFRAAA